MQLSCNKMRQVKSNFGSQDAPGFLFFVAVLAAVLSFEIEIETCILPDLYQTSTSPKPSTKRAKLADFRAVNKQI